MQENRNGYRVLLALVLGTAGAGLKLFYSFFPLFVVLDVLVFSLLGRLLGRLTRSPIWIGVAGLSLPPLLLIAYFLSRLGWTSLQQGIGMGWILSALLVPLAAGVGLYLSRGTVRVRTTGRRGRCTRTRGRAHFKFRGMLGSCAVHRLKEIMRHHFVTVRVLGLLLLTVGLLRSAPAASQQPALEPGMLIRVTTADVPPRRFVSEFQRFSGDTLVVATSHGLPRALPIAAIDRIEVRQPRSWGRGAWRGAGYGFAIPMAVGLAFSAVEEGAGAGLALFGLTLGPIGGAIYGAVRPGSTWKPAERSAL